MEYKVIISDFEGPLDLLLHLIKVNDLDIFNIKLSEITEQYLNYIKLMEELNLNIASDYIVIAAELIEMKTLSLLPNYKELDEEEENFEKNLIDRLIEYTQYKEMTKEFKELEEKRQEYYTKLPYDITLFKDEEIDLGDLNISLLLETFNKFLETKVLKEPLNTKVTNKEYSISTRSKEIKDILLIKKKVTFEQLFKEYNKEYIIITFLSILDMVKKQELKIIQNDNFDDINLELKGDENE